MARATTTSTGTFIHPGLDPDFPVNHDLDVENLRKMALDPTAWHGTMSDPELKAEPRNRGEPLYTAKGNMLTQPARGRSISNEMSQETTYSDDEGHSTKQIPMTNSSPGDATANRQGKDLDDEDRHHLGQPQTIEVVEISDDEIVGEHEVEQKNETDHEPERTVSLDAFPTVGLASTRSRRNVQQRSYSDAEYFQRRLAEAYHYSEEDGN